MAPVVAAYVRNPRDLSAAVKADGAGGGGRGKNGLEREAQFFFSCSSPCHLYRLYSSVYTDDDRKARDWEGIGERLFLQRDRIVAGVQEGLL